MKLVYFNARGLAETSRILLAISGIKYRDFRYPLEVIDFKTHNMIKKEFDDDKKSGKLSKSLGKLPYLEIDGNVIPQSKSIERFIAKRANMMGKNDIECAQIDSICEAIRDIKDAYQKVRRSEDPNDKKIWFTSTLPERMISLEQSLSENSDIYSVGDCISLSDVVIYCFICQFFDDTTAANKSIEHCPRLLKIVDHVSNLESVQKWLENRPQTDF